MSYAFSAKAILEQEELIIKYVDMLTVTIEEEGKKANVNLVEMFNWTTFDILGELGFGEPFGSLRNRKTDERVAVIFDLMKQVSQLQRLSSHVLTPAEQLGCRFVSFPDRCSSSAVHYSTEDR